jgi:MoaF N-terminal domain
MKSNPVAGKVYRFRFEDGPMAGKTIEHTFLESGALRFRQSDAEGEGTTEKKYAAATIAPDVLAVSYLGSSGYTLTVVLDERTKKLVAFSSNETMHLMQHGTFEEVEVSKSRSHARSAEVSSS